MELYGNWLVHVLQTNLDAVPQSHPLYSIIIYYILTNTYINTYIERMIVCSEEEYILMTSFVDSLSHLQVKKSKLIIY